MNRVDLNCDVGESFGCYRLGADDEIFRAITSANIACGFHAGDPAIMRRTVQLCQANQVAIGAHPGLPDLAGFGRRRIEISPGDAYEMTVYQLGALLGFVKAEGAVMQHVKPHGALYNMAATNRLLADAIAEAVYRVEPGLVLFGLSGSELVKAGLERGLRVAQEAFADRRYQPDGTLAPRNQRGAVLADVEDMVRQAMSLAQRGKVEVPGVGEIDVLADTICLHGDTPEALRAAMQIRQRLEACGVSVLAPGRQR